MGADTEFIEKQKAREALAELSDIHLTELRKINQRVADLEAQMQRAERTIKELREALDRREKQSTEKRASI